VTKKIGWVFFKGLMLNIIQTNYSTNGRIAIGLMEGGIPFGTISINLPEEEFGEGEFPVKNWSENEEITPFILAQTDLFEDTGKTVLTGFVEAPIWRFKKEEEDA